MGLSQKALKKTAPWLEGSLSLQGKDFVDELRSPVCKILGLFPLGMLRENGL